MSFFYPEEEEVFKAGLVRHPAHIQELQETLKHLKNEILTCKRCLELQNPSFAFTNASVSADGPRSPPTPSMPNLLPELLVEIFLLLSLEDPPLIREAWDKSQTKILVTPDLGWIRVTHVCRRWRQLAVATAALWTNFSHGLVLGTSWTEEFISRAKGANAMIPSFDDYPRSIDVICDYVVHHSPHIRDLTLSAEWTSMELMYAFCDVYLPMMVSVNLDAGRGKWQNPNLFGGYAPNLRHLRLCNIVPWAAHSFLGNLVELDVSMCDDRVTTVKGEVEPTPLFLFPPLAQVLDVLGEAFDLENLSLHYALPPEDLSVDDSRKVHFPRLKCFSMSGKIRDCVSFIKRLHIPHDTTMDLTCIPGLTPEKFYDLFRILAHRLHLAGEQYPAVERLEVGTGRFDDRVLIRMYTHTPGRAEMKQKTNDRLTRYHLPQLNHSSPKPMITLSLAYASPEEHEGVFRDFFASMPLHDLVYLNVYGCSYIQPGAWRSIIRDNYVFLQTVRFLVLGHDCTQYFFHAIHDGGHFLSDFGPPAFPNLDRLIFRRVDFSMFPLGAVSEMSFQDQMLYHLRERIRRGRPLRAVFFFSCQGIDKEWFRDLEEVVKFVRLGL